MDGKPYRVLLVDDEAGIRKILRLFLEREGYEVHEAVSGAQAKQIIEQAKADAARQADHTHQDRIKAWEEAEHRRNAAIEAAVTLAQEQAQDEVKDLKAQAEEQRRHLHHAVTDKTGPAAEKVLDYLKG